MKLLVQMDSVDPQESRNANISSIEQIFKKLQYETQNL